MERYEISHLGSVTAYHLEVVKNTHAKRLKINEHMTMTSLLTGIYPARLVESPLAEASIGIINFRKPESTA